MMEQREIYMVTGTTLEEVVVSINAYLGRVAGRLDQIEGVRGIPKFFSTSFNFSENVNGFLRADGSSAAFQPLTVSDLEGGIDNTDINGLGSAALIDLDNMLPFKIVDSGTTIHQMGGGEA